MLSINYSAGTLLPFVKIHDQWPPATFQPPALSIQTSARERKVGNENSSSFRYCGKKKGSGFCTLPSTRSSLSASPQATCKTVQLQNSDQPPAYREALRANLCDTDADAPVIVGQKEMGRREICCRERAQRSVIRQRSAPISTAVS